MFKFYINGKLAFTLSTENPHGCARDILVNAMLSGGKVTVVRAEKP